MVLGLLGLFYCFKVYLGRFFFCFCVVIVTRVVIVFIVSRIIGVTRVIAGIAVV
jgi:hypothetical protein